MFKVIVFLIYFLEKTKKKKNKHILVATFELHLIVKNNFLIHFGKFLTLVSGRFLRKHETRGKL
jgi:hypothetical protein